MRQLGYSGFALASVFAPKLSGEQAQEWTHTVAKVASTYKLTEKIVLSVDINLWRHQTL